MAGAAASCADVRGAGMFGSRLTLATLVTACLLTAAHPVSAQQGDETQPADGYDFLVLSLSWSPSYCEAEGEEANRQQCERPEPFGFVVHGLWPQLERGWPEYCASSEPDRVPDALVRDYLDIMPSAGLIGHQWRKHGSCSGLGQRDYLDATRAAFERITIPDRFARTANRMELDPDAVEAAFIDANDGLPAEAIAVTCESGLLREVRICLTDDLAFRPCAEVDRRSCDTRTTTMPAPD
jgi:ribonuclease T2